MTKLKCLFYYICVVKKIIELELNLNRSNNQNITIHKYIWKKVTLIGSDENNNHQNNWFSALNITQMNESDNACSPQMLKYIK